MDDTGRKGAGTDERDIELTEDFSVQVQVEKSEHKLLEEQGAFVDEPLLTESTRRFVILPIQDADVSSL
jgi:hypothetical protein